MNQRTRILVGLGVAAGLLATALLVVPPLMDLDHHRPALEKSAGDALGMKVRICGRLRVGVLPGLTVTMEDGRLLDERGAVVATAARVRLGIALLPLLRRELRVRRVELTRPTLSIQRDPQGGLNVARLKKAAALLGTLEGATVSLTGGTVRYRDLRSGARVEADSVALSVSRLRLARGWQARGWKGIALRARLTCGSIRSERYALSSLGASVAGQDGVFTFDPVTLRIFDGWAEGSLAADLSAAVPRVRARCSLRRFRVEAFLAALSPKPVASGTMDFSLDITLQGTSRRQFVQTASGEVSLRGTDLVLEGNDLDRGLARFESSQNFNLVDVGAVFFAGPLGLAFTKGYGFANLARGAGGRSRIHVLVSDWGLVNGVASARDVALATTENRVALRGALDLVQERFVEVTVAAIDADGCARVRQEIHGSFADPRIEKPNALRSVAGPVLTLFGRARGLFPSGPCDAFYSGAVAPPR